MCATAGGAMPTFRPCARFLSSRSRRSARAARKPQTKRPSISGFPTLLPTLTKWSSIPTWTSSRSACECLFTIRLGMAALNAGKHLYCEWPLAATTEQAQQMRELALRKGVRHMVGLQGRGAREFNRGRNLAAEGDVGKVLSFTMIITTRAWGAFGEL